VALGSVPALEPLGVLIGTLPPVEGFVEPTGVTVLPGGAMRRKYTRRARTTSATRTPTTTP